MSTLKVSAIQSPSTTDGGLSISATGAVSGGLPVPNRNLLYNGAMQVAQRGTSVAGATTGYNTADRWNLVLTGLGAWTQSVEADGPSGFASSLKMLCTTADASPASSDICQILMKMEGQDLQRVAKGTADAQQLTLSFWVKSNVTGTNIVRLYDNDNGRNVGAAYTVDASATWEYKTITFPADTTGALDNDNNKSLLIGWALGAGTDWTSGTLRSSWTADALADRYVGQTNLAAAVNNYWQITGVQLETGPVATEFEHRSFGDELARCQRYYWRASDTSANATYGVGNANSSTAFFPMVMFPQPMRAKPSSVEYANLAAFQYGLGGGGGITALSILHSCSTSALLNTTTSGVSSGLFYLLMNNSNTAGYIAFSAEL